MEYENGWPPPGKLGKVNVVRYLAGKQQGDQRIGTDLCICGDRRSHGPRPFKVPLLDQDIRAEFNLVTRRKFYFLIG